MRFELLRPQTLTEALTLLDKYRERGKIIAGGTDLLVNIKDRLINPDYVIDIDNIPALSDMHYDGEQLLTIGAGATIRTLERSDDVAKKCPVITQAAGQLGSIAIRNVATVGGNLCSAIPSADMAPALIGLGSRVKLTSLQQQRIVALEDFFTGPHTTVMRPDELLTEIEIPLPKPGTKGIYLKHAIRGTMDCAIVGVAVIISISASGNNCQDIRIVLGAVAPTPIRARNAEAIVRGQDIDGFLVNKCAEMAAHEATPISDARASAEYRREMTKIFTRQALRALWQDMSVDS